jgi:hypothetical protein
MATPPLYFDASTVQNGRIRTLPNVDLRRGSTVQTSPELVAVDPYN